MHEFRIHIGRHKTGTSSLQQFLVTNQAALLRRGIDYANEGRGGRIAHHDLASIFARRLRARSRELSAEERTEVAAVLEAERTAPVVLLSSEAFQNALPELVAQYFPRGRTKLVCYLREQVEYAVSAYQQQVHATNHCLPIEESIKRLVVNYDAFLAAWEMAFGADSLRVRCYDRQALKGGDIVVDFLDVLGIDDTEGLSFDDRDQNPSIGGALLEFKRVLNAFNDGSIDQRRMYRAMAALALSNEAWRRRPHLPPHLVETIRDSVRESNRKVFERYFGGREIFRFREIASPPDAVRVDAAEVVDLLGQLRALDEQLYSQISSRLLSERPPVDFSQSRGPGTSLQEMTECVIKALRQ
jgi:hypothetical protein